MRSASLSVLLLSSVLLAQQAKQPTSARPTKEQIARWIGDLAYDDFSIREKASKMTISQRGQSCGR